MSGKGTAEPWMANLPRFRPYFIVNPQCAEGISDRCTGKEPNSQQIRAPINEKPYPIYDQNYIEIPYNHPTALFAYFQAQNTLENAKK